MHPIGADLFPVVFWNMLLVVTLCVELVVLPTERSSEVLFHMVFRLLVSLFLADKNLVQLKHCEAQTVRWYSRENKGNTHLRTLKWERSIVCTVGVQGTQPLYS